LLFCLPTTITTATATVTATNNLAGIAVVVVISAIATTALQHTTIPN